ncbi:MAG: HAMP domain-containing histidine kinase, partial [Lachnospiraceae bacterium]|nr:HAMP domain-containing histidine kinase [Lachnospiraceae bacterium]
MNEIKRDETRTVAHVSLVTAIAVFSVVLVILNLREGWERWVVPIIVAVAVSCLVMHITAMPQSRIRLYAYSIVLIVYLFYYNTNTDVLYNGTPVVMLLVIVISMTREKRLVWACIVTGSLGMVMRISDPAEAGRVIWHVTLIVVEGAIASGMLKSSEKTSEIYRERIEKLELDNKTADDFLANVSHEIRTPIKAVIGLTGVCIDKEKDEEIANDLRSVSEAGRRIAEQISDILDYSETERDNISVIMEDYRLASLMNDLIMELKPYKSPELELVIDIDPTLPAVLRTDTLKLKRILWHVILNGLKYTKEGGVYVRITSTVQEYGINLCVDVTDTGVGMTPEEIERVFERFYQSDSGRTRVSGGLGLGMPIALGFAESLSGFLTVDSKPDAGTTVHICIPQAVVNEAPCMSVRSKDEFNVGAFLRFERYQDPNVREFYDNMIRNIVKGVR